MNLWSKIKINAADKSPRLWFIAGSVLVVAAVVDASKRRPKYEQLKEKFKENIADQVAYQEKFDAQADENGMVDGETYTLTERRVDRMKIAVGFGLKAIAMHIPTALKLIGGVVWYPERSLHLRFCSNRRAFEEDEVP